MKVKVLKDTKGNVFTPKVSADSVYLSGSSTTLTNKLSSVDTTLSGKADKFTVSSSTPTANWGGTIVVGTVAGTDLKFKMPANPDTHYTAKNVVASSSTGTANVTAATSNPYFNLVENGAVRSTHRISGSGATSVNTDTSGNIIISSTNTTYNPATQSSNGLMSSTDKTKLDGIATGAEVNQNAFSNVKVGDVTVAADTKTDTLTLVAGSNVTITPDAANDKITIASSYVDTTYSAGTDLELSKTTFNHANSGVSAGTYRSVTVNARGHVTAGTNPTTLSGYGITDAKIASGIITLGSNTITPLTADSTLAAGKVNGVLSASNIPDLDASKITKGTISVDRLPATALERCVVVADDTARFKLTTSSVQVGDTVKVTATKKMYMVIDSSKLSSEAGYEEYFTSTDWSTITNKPSSYTPSSHKHTKSQITDFPTSMPASDVYAWAKASTKPSYAWSEITDKPSTFTPSSHTQGEATLTWGGRNFAGTYGPVDSSMIPELSANRLAFGNPAGITIEYSRDGGSTWTDYGADNNSKVNLFSPPGASFSIGKADSNNKATADYLLRVTINTDSFGVYTALNKFMIYCSTNGSTGSYCSIDAALESTPTNFVNFANKVDISGWSGYNIINTSSIVTYGNNPPNQYGRLRFTFGCTGGSTTYSGLNILKIYGFGGVGWTEPSSLAKTGHIYSIGSGQSVGFPGTVSADGGFSGNLTGTASKATGDSKGQKITETYIKGLSASDTTITYTKGDGSTGTITTKDTTYSSKAAASGGTDVSLVTTGEKYIWNSKADGNHTHNYAGSSSVGGPANDFVAELATAASDRYVYFAYDDSTYNNSNASSITKGRAVVDSEFKYNPSTNTLTVGTVKGSLEGNATSSSSLKAAAGELTTQEAIDGFLGSGVQYTNFSSYSQVGFGGNDGMILSIPWPGNVNYGAQIAFDDSTTGLVKVRGKSSTWGSWKQLWKEGDSITAPSVTATNGFTGDLTGNAATATSSQALDGFTRQTSQTWGVQTGTFVHGEGVDGCDWGFRKDCPVSGMVSLIVDGRFYQNEGRYACIDTSGGTITGNLGVNGTLNAGSVQLNSAVTLQYNSSTESLDFIFA